MNQPPTYSAALELFHLLSGEEPDGNWRAFLRIATASPISWQLFSPYINMERQEVDLEALEHHLPIRSSGEALLVGLAISLYRDHGTVDASSLASILDDHHWEAALEALTLYRRSRWGRG